LTLFLVRFWAFLGKGSSKTPSKCFYKKSRSKALPEKIAKDLDVRFSSAFFVLSRFRVFLSDGSSKTLQVFRRFAKPGDCVDLLEEARVRQQETRD
jgi:hypothetical protein